MAEPHTPLIPAQAGIQLAPGRAHDNCASFLSVLTHACWTPAFAGASGDWFAGLGQNNRGAA
ncbi:hypothetical protein FHS46_003677 [Variibacter gotjawalensis]|nr:hypothetical protein [Variibacter gotjawalensis]RZS51211.1 hypothetical protein EV661_3688 [Variibacter gotjawalensis]